MRAVTSATAAVILGIDRRTFDNGIARLEAVEFPKGRQGVERRISVAMLPQLLLSVELTERFSLPFREAFRIARALAGGQQPGAPFLRLEADFALLREEVDRRLERAVETVVRRPRGRPKRTAP